MAKPKIISIETKDGVIVAAVKCASMDEESTKQMQTEVGEAAGKARELPLVLDLSQVEFFPSLSLGALVNLLRECKQHNQRFVLAGIQQPVRECLAITRLDKLFEICDDVGAALAQIRG